MRKSKIRKQRKRQIQPVEKVMVVLNTRYITGFPERLEELLPVGYYQYGTHPKGEFYIVGMKVRWRKNLRGISVSTSEGNRGIFAYMAMPEGNLRPLLGEVSDLIMWDHIPEIRWEVFLDFVTQTVGETVASANEGHSENPPFNIIGDDDFLSAETLEIINTGQGYYGKFDAESL